MTELQNPEVAEPEVVTSASNQTDLPTEEISPSASETPVEDKDNVQKRINALTAEKYAAKREAEELKRKLEEQSQSPVTPAQAPTDEPQMPDDVYDETAMQNYHREMVKYAQEQASKVAKSVYEQQQTEAQKTKQQREQQEAQQRYAQGGLEAGLTIDRMEAAEQTVVNAGIQPDLGMHIMSDPMGAKIVDYLASNPESLERVVRMSPMQAAAMIETEIKPKANGPGNITKAPDPVESVGAIGSTPALDPFEAGGGKFL